MKKLIIVALCSAINTIQAYSTIICNNTAEPVSIKLDYVWARDFHGSIPAKTCINQENLNTEHKNITVLNVSEEQFKKLVPLIKKLQQQNDTRALSVKEKELYNKFKEQIHKAIQSKSKVFVSETGNWGAAAFRGFTIHAEEKINNKTISLDHKFNNIISADLFINICYSVNYKKHIDGLVTTIRVQNPHVPFTEFTVTDQKKSYTYAAGIPLAGTENQMTDLNSYDKMACMPIDKNTLQKVKVEGYATIKAHSLGVLSTLLNLPATIGDQRLIDVENEATSLE